MTNLYPFLLTRLIILLASTLLVYSLETTQIGRNDSDDSESAEPLQDGPTVVTQAPLDDDDKEEEADDESLQDLKVEKEKEAGPVADSELELGHFGCGRVPIYEQAFTASINKSADEQVTRSSDRGDSRILYGLDAVIGEWPWIVRLSMCSALGDRCSYCTGTLLNSRWILTAAHCIKATNPIVATLGLYDLILPDKTSIRAECDKSIAHSNADMFNNDVGLLRLKKPIEFNEFIQPICLAPRDSANVTNAYHLARDKSCYTIGYGLNEEWGFPAKLQKLAIQTAKCDKLVEETGSDLAKTVCILPKRDELGGTCRGDSGGPDICYDNHTNRWFIIGVVSFGPSDCNQESGAGNWLTASVDVTNYRQWILDTIRDNND